MSVGSSIPPGVIGVPQVADGQVADAAFGAGGQRTQSLNVGFRFVLARIGAHD